MPKGEWQQGQQARIAGLWQPSRYASLEQSRNHDVYNHATQLLQLGQTGRCLYHLS